MFDDLPLSSFERRHIGTKNEFIFRRHERADEIARTLRRRVHPAWSQMRDEYRVTEAA